jgi:hypothetical protein
MEECPLDVCSIVVALGVSPTALYKYHFNRDINAAEQRQRENGFISTAAIERDYFKGEIRRLNEELEHERAQQRTGWPNSNHGGKCCSAGFRPRGIAQVDSETGSNVVAGGYNQRFRAKRQSEILSIGPQNRYNFGAGMKSETVTRTV